MRRFTGIALTVLSLSLWSAAFAAPAPRQPAPAPPPAGPLANLAFEIDLAEWKVGYPPQIIAALRQTQPEQYTIATPGYVAPGPHQTAVPQLPFGTPTQIYDGGDGVIIRVTPYPAQAGAAAQPNGPMLLDYEIEVDGRSVQKARLDIPGPKAGGYSDGYHKIPTTADPDQMIALQVFMPSTTRGIAGAVLPGMGAYSVMPSQGPRGRREGDDPAGPATCGQHVPMPSDDYVDLRKERGQIVVRAKADGSGYEALGGAATPPDLAKLPGPAKPAGGWCDQPPG